MSRELTVYEAIERRRDVRAEFSGDIIADDVLLRILAAAHRAPSVGNSQPWDFVIVQDPAALAAFAAHVGRCRDEFAASLPPDRAKTFAPIKIEGIRTSGTGIVVTHNQSRGGKHVLGRHTIADAGLFSTVLAIQNLWLAATAEGVGVGWVSFYEEAFLAELVGLPEVVRPIAWLCIGPVTHLQEVPDLERFGWRSRRPLAEAIHRERF